MTHSPLTTFNARSPEDVLAVVPVVLGFVPDDSVVMLTFGGAQTLQARLDLPPVGEIGAAVAQLLHPALAHGVTRVLFVVYGEDGITTRRLVERLRRDFGSAGVDVVEVLRAHEGRWFAPGRPGAPPGGVPYDVDDHPFRAEAVARGIVLHPSRTALADALRPVPDAVAETARALRRAAPSSPSEIADLVDVRLSVGRFKTPELARVLLGLLDAPGRDAAWGAMTRPESQAHVRLWTDTVQRAPDAMVAAPAAVLATAAWLSGHGALAWCAVDRCREVEPGNTLAALVADLLDGAVAPSTWPDPSGGGVVVPLPRSGLPRSRPTA